jgi:hypothetical protein
MFTPRILAALAALAALVLAAPAAGQPTTFTVDRVLDDGSPGTLRWAIGQVNAADTSNTAYTIRFAPSVGSTTVGLGAPILPARPAAPGGRLARAIGRPGALGGGAGWAVRAMPGRPALTGSWAEFSRGGGPGRPTDPLRTGPAARPPDAPL